MGGGASKKKALDDFDHFDANGDGVLDATEQAQLVEAAVAAGADRDTVQQELAAVDRDCDGVIDQGELMAHLHKLSPGESNLSPGEVAAITVFLGKPERLREEMTKLEQTVATHVTRPSSLAAYLGRNSETTVPPLGYVVNEDESDKERYPVGKLFGDRQLNEFDDEADMLHNLVLVTEPIDFSTPGEATSFVYHYTERHVVDLVFDSAKEVKLGGWLPIQIMQPGMLCTAGSGTFNDKPCIYVTSREPNSFVNKEAIAANNYGSKEHRLEKCKPHYRRNFIHEQAWQLCSHSLARVVLCRRAERRCARRVGMEESRWRTQPTRAPPGRSL
eukprot:COSAG02_NODE_14430_length_1273_cov_2.927598_1_plen_330_part_01